MNKHFKLIVTAFMMVAMLVNFSVPAMAAEQISDENCVTMAAQTTGNTENADSVSVAAGLVGQFHFSGRLTKGSVLGTVDVTSNAKSVQWTVGRTDSDGVVNLRLTNTSTGEVRSISAVADNMLDSMEWVSRLPAGEWEVSVIYVSSSWLYDVDLYFYT